MLALGVVVCCLLGAAPATAAPDDDLLSETIVSFTFDGTYKGQDDAARILAANGLAGTFYVNSGYLDYPAFLSVDDVRTIARQRSEVGGASLYGNDLSQLTVDQARQQVCNDRATLAQLGFQVTSFAYPHGAGEPEVKEVVQECGYNSSRDLAGLYEGPGNCDSCPRGETVPPTDYFRIRTNQPGISLESLKRHVEAAEDNGGGWVPLVFTHVCLCPENVGEAITPDDFRTFVEWMTKRPDTTSVLTVDQVMGGPLQPVVGVPLKRLVPDPSPAVSQPPETPRAALSQTAAWTILGVGIGQAQILAIGICVTIAVALTYRAATRGRRHAG